MGVYIEGMKMPPKGEYKATIYVDSDGTAYIDFDSREMSAYTVYYGQCKLVEVPKHGKLIDADATIADIRGEILEHQMNGMKGTPFYIEDLRTMWQRLEDEEICPTIIPAEEG